MMRESMRSEISKLEMELSRLGELKSNALLSIKQTTSKLISAVKSAKPDEVVAKKEE